MLGNYYTLAALAASLANRLAGKQIREIYTQEKSELIMAFDDYVPVLVISCNPRSPTCYLHPAMARARKNSTDVLSAASETSIISVSIHPGDRILTFQLRNGLSLMAQLFGTQSNVILVDEAGTISGAFKRGQALIGSRYEPRTPHLIHDIPLLRSMLEQEPGATVSAILKRVFPAFGTPLADEVIARTALLPGVSAGTLNPSGLDLLCSNALALLTELSSPQPRVYLNTDGTPALFSIVKLRSMANLTEKPFVDIHEAIRFFLSRRRSSSGLDHRKSDVISAINRLLEKDRRTADALEEEQLMSGRADEYEQNGKLLLAHLNVFQKGDRSVTIADASGTFTVPLDPKLSPVQNAQRWFDKAKRSRQASLIGTERLTGIRHRIARGKRLIEGISSAVDPESVITYMNEHNDEFEEFGLGTKSKAEEHLPFRLFTVEGGFEVWAGKSSANNDLLTLRHTKPNDLWFHARGSGGSHVVLKVGTGRGEPGKRAREQAAAIAAYYSKMKNAKIVPVAMTEKKYVRKPKGAPPGTVVLEREKVIFVEPALPAKEPE